MRKPASLRSALTAAVPWLSANPNKLLVRVTNGRIVTTGAPALSFEYQDYVLELIVIEFAGDANDIIVPILAWLQTHQPEMLQNRDRMKDGFKFEAEVIDHATVDISIQLRLSERVKVTEAGGLFMAEHLPEPPVDPWAGWTFAGPYMAGVSDDVPADALLTGQGADILNAEPSEYLDLEP